MATQSPISTISYNSEIFLKEKLDNLVKQHIIQTYQYIKHKGEDGDKDHIHLRIEPNRRLDPMDLTALFQEYTAANLKPLGVRPWRPSKEEDWFLYAVHDKSYMHLKYGDDPKEKLPYQWQDIVTPAEYDKETAYIRAKAAMQHSSANLANRIISGENAANLVKSGENPFIVGQLVNVLKKTEFEKLAEENKELEATNDALYKQVNLDAKIMNQMLDLVNTLGYDFSIDDDGKVTLTDLHL